MKPNVMQLVYHSPRLLYPEGAYLFDPIGPTQLAWTLFLRADREQSALYRFPHSCMNHSETHRRIIYGHDYDSSIDGISPHSITEA